MNNQEILSSIQTQLVILLPNEDIREATTFYNELISEMPNSEDINSFLIGVNTDPQNRQECNLTIITFNEFPQEKSPMNDYLTEKLNQGHDYTEWKWLGRILIISFDY